MARSIWPGGLKGRLLGTFGRDQKRLSSGRSGRVNGSYRSGWGGVAINEKIASGAPAPYHAVNVLLHMAVTDRNLYVSDNNNKRVLRVKLDYAASETVAAP